MMNTQSFNFVPKPLDFAVSRAVYEARLYPRSVPPEAEPQADQVIGAPSIESRACAQCSAIKPVDAFSRDGRGVKKICKACTEATKAALEARLAEEKSEAEAGLSDEMEESARKSLVP